LDRKLNHAWGGTDTLDSTQLDTGGTYYVQASPEPTARPTAIPRSRPTSCPLDSFGCTGFHSFRHASTQEPLSLCVLIDQL